MGKNILVREIVDIEWEMFDHVHNIGGRADCQEDKWAFYILRSSQFLAWDRASLDSYLQDLKNAKKAGQNIVEYKYAYMMRETDPEYFAKIEALLPTVQAESMEIIERLLPIHIRWAEEFYAENPRRKGVRKIRSYENTLDETSFETYLRGELMTYSFQTLCVYEEFVCYLMAHSRNLSMEIARNHFDATPKQAGFK